MSRLNTMLLLILGLAIGARAADDPATAPDDVLKEKGLRRSGSMAVLNAEADLDKALKAAQSLRRDLAVGSQRKQAAARGAAESKRLIVALTQQRLLLRQQLDAAATVEQRNQIINAVNDLGDRINLLNQGGPDPKAVAEFDQALARRREAYMQALLDAHNAATEVDVRYAELAEDADVRAALDELGKGRREKFALGPSRAFRANLKALEGLEKTVQTEKIALRNDNGSYWVDVVFNGKKTRPMIFDTGANVTNIPATLAAEVGLTIPPDAPTVRAQVADGSVVSARLIKVASLRVGEFAVEDVECTIMEGGGKEVPPLLGMSFLKHFTYKLDPTAASLTLTRLEPTAAGAGAKPKAQPPRRGANP